MEMLTINNGEWGYKESVTVLSRNWLPKNSMVDHHFLHETCHSGVLYHVQTSLYCLNMQPWKRPKAKLQVICHWTTNDFAIYDFVWLWGENRTSTRVVESIISPHSKGHFEVCPPNASDVSGASTFLPPVPWCWWSGSEICWTLSSACAWLPDFRTPSETAGS